MTSLSSLLTWLFCVGLLFLSEGPQRSCSLTSTAVCDSSNTLSLFSYEEASDYAGDECDTSSQLIATDCHFEGNGVQQIRVWEGTDGSDTFITAISLSTFDGQACTLGDMPSNQDPLASFEFTSGEHLMGSISIVRTTFSVGSRITKLSFATRDGNSFLAESVITTSSATSVLDEIDTSSAFLMGFFAFESSSSGSWIEQSIEGIGFFFFKEIENQYLTNVVYTDLTDDSVVLASGPVAKLFFSFNFQNPQRFEGAYQVMVSGIEASETREWNIKDSFSWSYGESVVASIPRKEAIAEPVDDTALWEMGLESQAVYSHNRFVSNPNEVALDLSVPACSKGSVEVTFLEPTAHIFQFEGTLMYEFTDGTDYSLPVTGSYEGVVTADPITDESEILQYESGEASCADLAPVTAPSTTVTVPTSPLTAPPVTITTASPTIAPTIAVVDTTKAPTAPVDGPTLPPAEDTPSPTSPPVVIAEPPGPPTVKLPTAAPSFSPTTSLQMELFQNVVMTLSPWNTDVEMSGQNNISFEKLTALHIELHIRKSKEGGAEEFSDVQAFTNIVDQEVVIPTPTANTRDSAASYTPSTIRITFDVVLYFRAKRDDKEYDISKIIFDAWDTPDDRSEYIEVLLAETKGLGDVSDVVVEVDGVSTESDGLTGGDNGPAKKEKKGGTAGPVVGAVVGALFFLVMAFYLPRIRPLIGKKKKPADGLSEST
jgi:hypothetical protein